MASAKNITEGAKINTGLTIRGFEVWALTPNHYRHYHTLFLRVPGEFPTEAYEDKSGRWLVGFLRPDGVRQATYSSYATREEAETARTTYEGATAARIGCQFEVGYKMTDASGHYLPYGFCAEGEVGAKAWGKTWVDANSGYPPLKFDLTEDEARSVIKWREQADAAWLAARPDFVAREQRILDAQSAGLPEAAAEFAVDAVEALGGDSVVIIADASASETECLECGATYPEAGHVEPGGMGCRRCN